ncbi:DUF1697 domain-containing protein [Microbacterium trichothecenolyticum]|uniref:DUF1697 domain-containing protein n=1 Tax=Microbacterium ureisolvens TaxID=2781186 RepID=A0ABS7HWM5_9MICO|nr:MULTISPECIES: DUF1697 domain-containing protein [Microbacterium]MBW9109777.1 DUF1697 domain-containing protein [Microbacterium ureisolvens]MBW9121179.1 DUF1697 domain-containing protein [Microbacterium trichothecenolyticum]
MPTYVAFLRAINLGANRKFPKADIVRVVESVGFTDVETHINTGNVRFTTPMRSRAKIEKTLEDAFAADRGFDVPTIVFTTAELKAIAAEASALTAENPGLARHYVYLLKEEPSTESRTRIAALDSAAGEMVVSGRAAHALLGPGYQAGSVDALKAEKLLGVATNRNLNVITAIADKWC